MIGAFSIAWPPSSCAITQSLAIWMLSRVQAAINDCRYFENSSSFSAPPSRASCERFLSTGGGNGIFCSVGGLQDVASAAAAASEGDDSAVVASPQQHAQSSIQSSRCAPVHRGSPSLGRAVAQKGPSETNTKNNIFPPRSQP